MRGKSPHLIDWKSRKSKRAGGPDPCGADPGLILREIEQGKTRHRASAEMVEITAYRLLTHLLRPVAAGQPMTEQAFDGLLEEVKKHKARVAEDRLKDHDVTTGGWECRLGATLRG